MKSKLLIILWLVSLLELSAKEIFYPINEIPQDLKGNAKTIVRLKQHNIVINSMSDVVVDITEVRTILSKNGDDESKLVLPYNSLMKVKGIKGRIFNAEGTVVRKINSDDINDFSNISGFSLYEDSRVKFVDPKYEIYPYTIEYTFQINLSTTMFMPSLGLHEFNTSFEKVNFKITAPSSFSYRYKIYGDIPAALKSEKDGNSTLEWNMQNIKAIKREPKTSKLFKPLPEIALAPNQFMIDGQKGDFTSWNSYGNWLAKLLVGKNNLSDATKQKMISMTANCKNDFEKVRIIYEYMQQKTRYVSIQVGFGGWVPFDAETVDRLSYGDCKALSNYTIALLSAVGIKSYYCVIRAGGGEPAIDANFPSNQFNHAFVAVPVGSDTLWLECTSQRIPCGFNGDFTDNRYALLVDKENSRLVRTRKFDSKENITRRKSEIKINEDLSGVANIRTIYQGLDYDSEFHNFFLDAVDQKKNLAHKIPIASCSLNNFSYQNQKSMYPSLVENQQLVFDNYLSAIGTDFLLPLNFYNKLKTIPDKVRNRKYNFILNQNSVEIDSIDYVLPVGLKVKSIPKTISMNSKYGSYNVSVKQVNGGLLYVRRFEQYEGEFPAEEYNNYLEYLESIVEHDGLVVTLSKW